MRGRVKRQRGGTTSAASPRRAALAAAAAAKSPGLAPIEITVSGVDGHGPVSTSITSLSPAPPAPGKVVATPAQQAADPLSEGITASAAPAATGRLHAHSDASTTLLANGLDLSTNGSGTFTGGGMRYVYANLKVRNAQ